MSCLPRYDALLPPAALICSPRYSGRLRFRRASGNGAAHVAGSVLPAGDAAIISRERGQIGVTVNPPEYFSGRGMLSSERAAAVPVSAESRWTCSYLCVLEAGGDVNEQSQLQRLLNIAGKSFIQKKKKKKSTPLPPSKYQNI